MKPNPPGGSALHRPPSPNPNLTPNPHSRPQSQIRNLKFEMNSSVSQFLGPRDPQRVAPSLTHSSRLPAYSGACTRRTNRPQGLASPPLARRKVARVPVLRSPGEEGPIRRSPARRRKEERPKPTLPPPSLSHATPSNIGFSTRCYRVSLHATGQSLPGTRPLQPFAFILQPFLPNAGIRTPKVGISAPKPGISAPNVGLSAPKLGLDQRLILTRKRLSYSQNNAISITSINPAPPDSQPFQAPLWPADRK